jgi:hypothetical protein
MTQTFARRFTGLAAFAAFGVCASLAPAAAQVTYARPAPFEGFFAPYDESYGTSPSFEIAPDAYGSAPAVRIVERCQYPNGWNVTDFNRDVNGTPAGLDHTCPVTRFGRGVRARY